MYLIRDINLLYNFQWFLVLLYGLFFVLFGALQLYNCKMQINAIYRFHRNCTVVQLQVLLVLKGENDNVVFLGVIVRFLYDYYPTVYFSSTVLNLKCCQRPRMVFTTSWIAFAIFTGILSTAFFSPPFTALLFCTFSLYSARITIIIPVNVRISNVFNRLILL